jgi:HTH-type transcriptional regulator / antitoxin HigA
MTFAAKLPERFEGLVALMPPRAIVDDVQLENVLEMIDRLMASGRLTKGQASYLETLVQLVEVYERAHHAIESADISGLDLLRHLLDEHAMSAADLGRLLGTHPSMGSKILTGRRALTVSHIRKLAEHFKLAPAVFLDE